MTACCGRCLDGSELSQPQSCALLPTDALLTHSGLPASPPPPAAETSRLQNDGLDIYKTDAHQW